MSVARPGADEAGAVLVDVTPESAGWRHAGLQVVEVPAAVAVTVTTGPAEALVLPLAGAATVTGEGERFDLVGRASVFDAVSDFVYLPRESAWHLTSAAGGRFAIASARCTERLEPRYGAAGDVPVELRGAGSCSRQVNNLCLPDSFPADRLMVCEVLTPGGNWSSYPPHKHDTEGPDESALEEIYYYEVAVGGGGAGVAYQRAYASDDRPIDILAEVRSGDVVLIPHGWHGPSMASPGHDLYYLNVMAGPGPERAWRISDDPGHAWVHSSWTRQEMDPRLPLTEAPS